MGSYFLLICFYVLLLIKSGFMRFANHWILVSSIFYTATQPFQNWVVFGSMEPFSAVVILGFMTLFRAKYKTWHFLLTLLNIRMEMCQSWATMKSYSHLVFHGDTLNMPRLPPFKLTASKREEIKKGDNLWGMIRGAGLWSRNQVSLSALSLLTVRWGRHKELSSTLHQLLWYSTCWPAGFL